jgi:3-methyladenine DNA glycosylase Tag
MVAHAGVVWTILLCGAETFGRSCSRASFQSVALIARARAERLVSVALIARAKARAFRRSARVAEAIGAHDHRVSA